MRSDAENDVVDGANAQQTAEVEQRFAEGKFAANVVENGHADDDHRPERHKESRQQPRHGEGVERRVIVELFPEFGRKHLKRGVEGGGNGDDDGQEHRIERVDVVEMDDVGVVAIDLEKQVEEGNQDDDDERIEHVLVGKGRNELRNRVVGHDCGQQFGLARPTELRILRGNLHPDGINRVVGHHAEVGHDEVTAFLDDERVGHQVAGEFLGLLPKQVDRVGLHHEIVVEGIVPSLSVFLVVTP